MRDFLKMGRLTTAAILTQMVGDMPRENRTVQGMLEHDAMDVKLSALEVDLPIPSTPIDRAQPNQASRVGALDALENPIN